MTLRTATLVAVCAILSSAAAGAQSVPPSDAFSFSGATGAQIGPFGLEGGTWLGHSIASSGDVAIVGSEVHDFGNGVAVVFERSGGGPWTEVQQLWPAAPSTSGLFAPQFGSAVSADGDRVAIGAPWWDVSGAVFVFERQPNGSWVETAKLEPSSANFDDHFGAAVDLDGDRLVVGVPNGGPGSDSTGSVETFELHPSGAWVALPELFGADSAVDDEFGRYVDLDGDRLVVSAPGHDGGAGAAYVYDFVAAQGSWRPTAKLAAEPPGSSSGLGPVAVEGDLVVVGDPGRDAGPGAPDSGGLRLYGPGPGGSWAQTAVIDPPAVEADARFGSALALEGGRLVASAPAFGPSDSGAAWQYLRTSDGSWADVARLVAEDPTAGLGLGHALALDGDDVLLGAPGSLDPTTQQPNHGAVASYRWATLAGDTPTISVSAGGTQELFLRAGEAFAGDAFLFLGNQNGATPGFTHGPTGIHIPINIDPYLLFVLDTAGGPVQPGFGVLDQDGWASSSIAVPTGTSPLLAGESFAHLYLTFDAASGFLLTSASTRVELTLVP